MATEADILDLEKRRCEAIGKGDFNALREVLADDYTHIFGGGETTRGKEAYIQRIQGSPRAPVRGNLTVRLYGNAAALTGDLLNNIEIPGGGVRVVDTTASQMAVLRDGNWQFVTCQLTQKKIQPAPKPAT